MNLRQLRMLCEIVDQNLNMSAAAKALHTSQPGISKQIKLLEDKLSIRIFIRRSNRIEAITTEGMEVVTIARRILSDAQSILRLKETHVQDSRGTITLAATYAHGRYLILPVVENFKKQFPQARFRVIHAITQDIFHLVSKGDVDMGICISHAEPPENIVQLPLNSMKLCVVTPPKHPLLRRKPRSLHELAEYPFIGIEASIAGMEIILNTFKAQSVKLDTVLSASDPDAIKAYVALGMGVAILPSMAFDPVRDRDLRSVEVTHLFPPLISCVVLDKQVQIRPNISNFIKTLRPEWTNDCIQSKLPRSE